MPIKGLTDRTAYSFAEVGRIRLGTPKTQGTPSELPYFRVEFRADEQDAAATFRDHYGAQPTRINIRLPFTDISQVWDANYECYNKQGMLGMSDGERWIYLRAPSGETLVRDGEPYTKFDKNTPVYSYPNNKGEDVGVFAKATGRLKVVVPELQRVAYLVMVTHSYYNIANLTAELQGIKEITGNIAMVPLVLVRRQEQISVNINGRKSQAMKYLVHVEIDTRHLVASRTFAIGAPAPTQIALPEPQDLEETEPDGYIDQPPEPEPMEEEPPDLPPAKVSEIARPYSPLDLKAYLLSLAAENESDQKIPQKTIGALVANLDYCMPEPKTGNRHAFISWVFAISSCNNLTWGQGKALKTWLDVVKIDDHWLPAAIAMREATDVINWLNKTQPKLFD